MVACIRTLEHSNVKVVWLRKMRWQRRLCVVYVVLDGTAGVVGLKDEDFVSKSSRLESQST